jgi:hypothetical protein
VLRLLKAGNRYMKTDPFVEVVRHNLYMESVRPSAESGQPLNGWHIIATAIHG